MRRTELALVAWLKCANFRLRLRAPAILEPGRVRHNGEARALSSLVRADTCSNIFARGNSGSWAQQGNKTTNCFYFYFFFFDSSPQECRPRASRKRASLKAREPARVCLREGKRATEGHNCMIRVCRRWVNELLGASLRYMTTNLPPSRSSASGLRRQS